MALGITKPLHVTAWRCILIYFPVVSLLGDTACSIPIHIQMYFAARVESMTISEGITSISLVAIASTTFFCDHNVGVRCIGEVSIKKLLNFIIDVFLLSILIATWSDHCDINLFEAFD